MIVSFRDAISKSTMDRPFRGDTVESVVASGHTRETPLMFTDTFVAF